MTMEEKSGNEMPKIILARTVSLIITVNLKGIENHNFLLYWTCNPVHKPAAIFVRIEVIAICVDHKTR